MYTRRLIRAVMGLEGGCEPMKALIVYDSHYGNTAAIARAIAEELGPEADLRPAEQLDVDAIQHADLVLVGSPTQKWHETSAARAAVELIGEVAPVHLRAAAFDTEIGSQPSGSAARRLDRLLRRAGLERAVHPARFVVESRDGPLAQGEIAHAKAWARTAARGA